MRMHGDRGLSRREVVAAGLAAAGAASLGRDPRAVAWAARRSAVPLAAEGAFEQGVAAGQPNLRGITLWTRVEGLERSSRLDLEIARDPGFANVVERREVRAAAIRDFAVKERVLTRRLSPGEQYFYRFATRTSSSPVGRFRTARPADSREPVRIGFFSCQKWPVGFYTAHAGLAQEDLDLVICLGDYVYEGRQGEQPIAERQDRTGANGDAEVQTLDEFRAKYQLYKSDPDLQAMHAAHAFQPIWDDHEAENDYAGETEGTGTRGERRVPFEERKRAGYLSFFEFHPIERVRSERNRIYRKLSLGANADLFMLDERQYRSPLLCDSASPCPEANDAPQQTLLGAAQLQWLKSGLSRSRATWKLLGNQVMMMGLDLPPGITFNADQWDGYATERRDLIQHIRANGIGDVSVLTGDIHTFFAGTVTDSGRFVGGRAGATEFVGGSITSEGIPEALGATEPEQRRIAALLTERIMQLNPHIAYTEHSNRGYGIVEARPDELRVSFRAPETIATRTSPMRTLAAFRVAKGSGEVERV